MTLTNTACKNAKPQQKRYRIYDTGGLYLEVMPNGSKYWRLKYRYLGQEKLLAIGVYPLVSLAEAHEARDKAKKLLAADINPGEAKKKQRQQAIANSQNTFELVAREWHENQLERWQSKHALTTIRRLENNIFLPILFF